uniref:External alternative NADH-ubiquinone oxidoreductase-like C-terminal domain-containing protein n=1 Tax=Clytia hemisphaerica TaxID=252671 RepID=A0A7M5XKE2_9CNID
DVLNVAKKRYPHLCSHFNKLEKLLLGVQADSENVVISHEDFTLLAQKADEKQTFLPPTAQVAAQEGKYLGKLLSKVELSTADLKNVDPFQYNHLGSFAYVGDNRAVLELPILGSFEGWSAMWLWRGAYASECVSLRMRTLVLFDWIKSFLFGRDTSRI